MTMLKIYTSVYPAGVELKSPSKFKVTLADLDSDKSTRSAKGVMTRDRIRARVRTLEVEWSWLTRAEMKTLQDHFNSDAQFTIAGTSTVVPKFFIALTYPDPQSTGLVTRVFYVSDRNSPLYNHALGKWESLSLSLVER